MYKTFSRGGAYRAEELSSSAAPVVSRWAVVVSSSAFIAVVSPRSGAAPVFSSVAPEQAVMMRQAVESTNQCGTGWMRIQTLGAGGSTWSCWGIAFHIAAYPNVGKTLDATKGDLECDISWWFFGLSHGEGNCRGSPSVASSSKRSRPRSSENTWDKTVVVAGTRPISARFRRVSDSPRRSFPLIQSASNTA